MGRRTKRAESAGDEPFVNTKGLGEVQIAWLVSTHEHRDYWKDNWYAGCGRVWTTNLQTTQLCEGLVKRGLMQRIAKPKLSRVEYWLTKAGIKFAEEWRAQQIAEREKKALLQ